MQVINAAGAAFAEADCGSISSDAIGHSKTRKKVLYIFPPEIFSRNSIFSIVLNRSRLLALFGLLISLWLT